MLGVIGQSARSTDPAALLKDQLRSIGRAAIGRSRNNRSIAQQSVDRAMNIFARLTDRATSIFSRYQPIAQERLCTINRLCRKSFARSTDRAGKVLRDLPIVQE